MAMNIKDPAVHELARSLAERRGITLTAAVRQALQEALTRSSPAPHLALRRERLDAIARRCAELSVLDARSADAILGYDDDGLPR